MSRPPRPRTGPSTTGSPPAGRAVLDYLPSEFDDFVERQRELAAAELGLVSSGEEGDFAGTLMELSALVAHVLGVYQDRFATEAFLGTAQSARSLIRHGRRLGYEPDTGLSATGHIALTIRDGLRGTVARGLALSSAPVGEKKAQDYETLHDIDVDAAHNVIEVKGRLATKLENPISFEVKGTGLGLEEGDLVVLETPERELLVRRIAAPPIEAEGRTTVKVDVALPSVEVSGYVMHAKPASRLRLFGADAAASVFPDTTLAAGLFPQDKEAPYPHEGYVADGYSDSDIYLASVLDKPIADKPIVRVDGSGATVYRVESARRVAVWLGRIVRTWVKVVEGWDPKTNAPQFTDKNIDTTSAISGAVTAFRVMDTADKPLSRKAQSIRGSLWLADFRVSVPLVLERPSMALIENPLAVSASAASLASGDLLVLATRREVAERVAEIAEVTSVSTAKDGGVLLGLRVVDPPVGGRAWKLGELEIRGNVARVSHGKTIEEVLGDSDGITPFLRFSLKDKPLTYVPGPSGGEPALEVRVAGVRWNHVQDFEGSDASDRSYILQRDDAGMTTIVFGDGRSGAIPPSGKRHITAIYRVGLGRDGNAGEGGVSRIKKAHPLVQSAENPRPVTGGAEPAGAEDVRTQAPLFIKTFDRAVSVDDHADLALLFPGVARAAAFWTTLSSGLEGIMVIVADAAGAAPSAIAIENIRKFLAARRDESVPFDVDGPSPVYVQLRVYVEIDPDFSPDTVKRALRAALHGARDDEPALFSFPGRTLGQPSFLSEIYDVITRVPGVAFAQVRRFDFANATGPWRVRDTIAAAPNQWLRLLPLALEFVPASEQTP